MPTLPSSLTSLSRAPALTVPETAGCCLQLSPICLIREPRRGVPHWLTVVMNAAIYADVAGYRSNAAIAE
ncbi:hypothetical protein [Actinoplanes sp. NPDC051859]|uniref:hypothetical protein n=1 Tax=Actinoplanes sp. NPDC051859 TaxID=3363909 RepID=UPI0037928C3A